MTFNNFCLLKKEKEKKMSPLVKGKNWFDLDFFSHPWNNMDFERKIE